MIEFRITIKNRDQKAFFEALEKARIPLHWAKFKDKRKVDNGYLIFLEPRHD